MKRRFRPEEKAIGVWNSSFIRILFYAIFCQFTMSISNTVLPLYVINSLGYSNTGSGLLGAVIDAGGFSVSFYFAAGYMTLYGIVAFFVLRKQKPIREIQSPAAD